MVHDMNIAGVKVYGFPKEKYNKLYLDTLNSKGLDVYAFHDEDVIIFENTQDFLDLIVNTSCNKEQLNGNWWYFGRV